MPQRKKKPITVGKRTSYSTGSRPVSSKPSQASKVRAAKKTTSSKYRARRQKASTAKVTESKPTLKYQGRNRKITEAGEGRTGLRKYTGSAKVTTGRGRSGPKLPKLPSKSRATVTGTGRKPSAAMPKESAARKAARLANRAAKGYRGAGGSALSKVGGALVKAAGRVAVPLAMVNEVRTMAKRQKRYNAQKAAMKRRKKK
jgi:hypothetical protein